MMILDTVHQLTDAQANVQIAAITGFFALLGIIAAAVVARISSHPKTPVVDPDEKHSGKESLLSQYTGEQNEFMHLVIADSKAVHERLANFEGIVDQLRKERTHLIGAFTRYITKLVGAWGSGGKMPYPDGEDFKILEETLPVDWRRRTR